METLTFPRWKGEHTRRAAHAPRRRVLHGLQEARVAGCLPRRRSARSRPGQACHGAPMSARHANSVVGRRCRSDEGHAVSRRRARRAQRDAAATGRQTGGLARTPGRSGGHGDSGARRRSAGKREQRRQSGRRHRTPVGSEHWCRKRDMRLRVELVPFYRHALPMRTARPMPRERGSSGMPDVDSPRKSLNSRQYTRG